MYKQCFELLSAQGKKLGFHKVGNNPQKNFQVMQTPGVGEMKKSYDSEAKGNIYTLEGHKVMMPPLGPDHGGRASLNITHRFLVF